MAVVFTAILRVRDWPALRRLSDELLIVYARAAGARRYRLYRNVHDAAEALLLVEIGSAEALLPLRDALLHRDSLVSGELASGGRGGPPDGRVWEPAACLAIERAARAQV